MPVATSAMPCRFQLYRHRDVSGVSGTGVVAWGTVYPNGKVSLVWCGPRPSVNVYESLADVTAIHGHDGSTQIIMYDELPDSAAVGW
ncbi:hypothetical protein DFJ64_1130 [Thermasporomyces composti]|jgi:hypothetical protein|uniref:Uncharacterized protein n=1 Tax=Thermasporomyces composti TaxID=696763 RepID=A0A3D9V6D0_THECX|nr:hypothetical protein DFJ64_1130 [Thermasporomyces composti]